MTIQRLAMILAISEAITTKRAFTAVCYSDGTPLDRPVTVGGN